MSRGEGDAVHPIPLALRGRADSGILVFSSSCTVLYANQLAHQFLRRLNRVENGDSAKSSIPTSVADLLDVVLTSLETRTAQRARTHLEAKRLMMGQDQPLLLRVFVTADQPDITQSRIVLTIRETIGASPDTP